MMKTASRVVLALFVFCTLLVAVSSASPGVEHFCNHTVTTNRRLFSLTPEALACSEVQVCLSAYCECTGLGRFSNETTETKNVTDTCISEPNSTTPTLTCSQFSECTRQRHVCLQRSGEQCEDAKMKSLYMSMLSLELGAANYSETPLLDSCKHDLCDRYTQLDALEVAPPFTTCSRDDVTFATCRSHQFSDLSLTISGAHWINVLSDNYQQIQAALEADATMAFGFETLIGNLKAGSLIADVSIQAAWTTELEKLVEDAGSSNTWLSRTQSIYTSLGGTEALTVMNLARPTPAPTNATATPEPEVEKPDTVFGGDDACGTGCIIGATVGSVIGALLIGFICTSLFYMRRSREPKLTARKRWLEEDIETEATFTVEYPNKVLNIQAKATIEMIRSTLRSSNSELDFFKTMSSSVVSFLNGSGVDQSIIHETYAYMAHKRLNSMDVGLSSKTKDGSTTDPAKRNKKLVRTALSNLMDRHMVNYSGGVSDTNWMEDILPEHVALFRTMFERDSNERVERACYFDFSANEAESFRGYLDRTRVHRENEDEVDCRTFQLAFRITKGHWPGDQLQDRIFTHRNGTIDEKVFIQNMTTSPNATERCFAYDYTKAYMEVQRYRRDFWLYLLFIIFFICQLVLGSSVKNGYYTQAGVSDKFDEDFGELGLTSDVWKWMEEKLISTLWEQQADADLAHLNANGFIVGGLMVRQVRVQSEVEPKIFQTFFDTDDDEAAASAATLFAENPDGSLGRRYRKYDGDLLDESSFGLALDTTQDQDIRNAFKFRGGSALNVSDEARGLQGSIIYPTGGHAMVFPLSLNKSTAISKLQQLKAANWIDRHTRVVICHFFVFNKDTSAVTRFRYMLETTPGGSVVPTRNIDVFTVFSTSSPLFSAAFFAFLFLCPVMLVFFIIPLDCYDFLIGVPRTIMHQRHQQGLGLHLRYILSHSLFEFWPTLRFVNACLFITSWTFRFWWIASTYESLTDSFYITTHFPADLDALGMRHRIYIYIVACNVMLTFITLLFYCRIQPALSAVTRTISRASQSLFGIALIFLIMMIAFSLCTYIIYGNNIADYSTFLRSLGANSLVLIEIYDYEAWKESTRIYTPIFYTLFMVFMVLLLLNFIISVLMDAFADESEEAFKTDDILSLITNDATETLLPPTLGDHIKSTSVLSFIRTITLIAHYRLKQFVRWVEAKAGRVEEKCFVNPHFSYRDMSKEVWRGYPISFWQDMHRAVRRMCNGTFFDAYVGLAYVTLLQMPLHDGGARKLRPPSIPLNHHHDPFADSTSSPDPSETPLGKKRSFIPHQDEEGRVILTKVHNARPRSLFRYLWKRFDSSTVATLALLQELPNYHLQIPSSVLIMDILRHHWYWEKRVSAYKVEDESETPTDVVQSLITDFMEIQNALENPDDEDADPMNDPASRRQSTVSGMPAVRGRKRSQNTKKMKKDLFDNGTLAVNTFFVCPINPDQAEKLIEFKKKEVMNNTDFPYTNAIPVQNFVDKWNELEIGKETYRIDDFGWFSEACDFDDVATDDTTGNKYIFTRIIDTLVELGEGEFKRRKRQQLSLMWPTNRLAAFQNAVRSIVKDRKLDFNFKDDVFPTKRNNDSDGPQFDVFTDAWKVAGHDQPPGFLQIAAHESKLQYHHFCAFCTKDPTAHSVSTYPIFLADMLKQKSKDVFSAIWYAMFLILFTYFVLSARGLGNGIFVNDSINAQFGDNFKENVKNSDTFYTWLKGELIENIYTGPNTTGVTTLPDTVNVPVGALKIRNVRVRLEDCSDDLEAVASFSSTSDPMKDYFYKLRVEEHFTSPCTEKWCRGCRDKDPYSFFKNLTASKRLLAAFQYSDCDQIRGQGDLATPWEYYSCSGHTLTLPLNRPKAEILEDIKFLEENKWIDKQSSAVIVDLHLFNYNMRALSRWRFGVEMPTPGGVIPAVDHLFVVPFLYAKHSFAYVFFFCFYLVFVALSFWSVFRDLITLYLRYRRVGVDINTAMYKAVSHSFWWFVRLAKCVLLVFAWSIRVYIMWTGNNELALYDNSDVVDNVEELAELQRKMDFIDATTIVVCYFLILYYFRMAPHLNVLVRTLRLASRHVISLSLVFYIVFFCFALTGYFVYGNVLREFSSFAISQTTLFLVLLGQEADYQAMQSYHPVFSAIFYTVFLIACMMILFNLIISVLGVAFNAASEEMYDLVRFRSVFTQDTTTAKEYSDDVNVLWSYLQILYGELFLVANQLLYYASFPFVDRPTRLKRKATFMRNPRYFWTAVSNCLISANPRKHFASMLRSLDIPFIPVVKTLEHEERREGEEENLPDITKEDSSISVDPLAQSFAANPRDTLRERRDREAQNEQVQEIIAMNEQISMESFITHSQVAQAFSDKKERVVRLHEFMNDELGEDCDSALTLAKEATKVTGMEGKVFLEEVLQAKHLYNFIAEQHTISSMDLDEAIKYLAESTEACMSIMDARLHNQEEVIRRKFAKEEEERKKREKIEDAAIGDVSRTKSGEVVEVFTLEHGTFTATVGEVLRGPNGKVRMVSVIRESDGQEITVPPSGIVRHRVRRQKYEPSMAEMDSWFDKVIPSPDSS